MVSLLWVLYFLNSFWTSRFAKAIIWDEMERDNGSLGLKYLRYKSFSELQHHSPYNNKLTNT